MTSDIAVLELEIEKFASWFHQDYGLVFDQADDGVKAYLANLSDGRKRELAIEVSVLLKRYAGMDHKGLKNAWLRLGAQWWSAKEIPEILIDVANLSG